MTGPLPVAAAVSILTAAEAVAISLPGKRAATALPPPRMELPRGGTRGLGLKHHGRTRSHACESPTTTLTSSIPLTSRWGVGIGAAAVATGAVTAAEMLRLNGGGTGDKRRQLDGL